MPSYESGLRQAICRVGRRLYDRFFVAGNDGNISVRLSADEILITPSGVSKGLMQPEMLVKIRPGGEVIEVQEGFHPSSETPMHLAIYRHRPDVRAVIHAHPPTATGFAVAGIGLDKLISPEVVVRTGLTPLVPYTMPGGEEALAALIPFLQDYQTLLMSSHGVVVYSATLESAYDMLETVEMHARIRLVAEQLGHVVELTEEQVAELRARYG